MANLRLYFIVFTLLIFSLSLFSTTYTSTRSGDWNNAATWGGGGYPIAGDDAIISDGHTVTLTENESCNDLTMVGISAPTTRLAISIYTLRVTGVVNGPSTSFTTPVITTSGAGRLKFVGASRYLFGLNWCASHGDWTCEVALTTSQVGTTYTDIEIGYLIVTSGTFQVGGPADPKNLYIDGTGSDNTGTIYVANAASLICTGTCGLRNATATTYCSTIDLYGNLTIQGVRLNGTVNVKSGGKLTLKRLSTTALLSTGNAAYNFSYATGSTLQYELQGAVGRIITGAEINHVTNSTTHELSNITLYNSSGINLQDTPTVYGTLKIQAGNITSTVSKIVIFGEDGILHYAGTSLQTSTDMEFPSSSGPNSLIVENSANVDLHANRTINGTLSIIKGNLTSSTGKILSFGSLGFLEYKGVTAQLTNSMEFPASNGPAYLTIINAAGVTIHADRTLSRDLYITGTMIFNDHTITLTRHHMAITGTSYIYGFQPTWSGTTNNLGAGHGISLPETWLTQGGVDGTVDITLFYNESENSDDLLSCWNRGYLNSDPTPWTYYMDLATNDLGTTRSVVLAGLSVITSPGDNGLYWTLSPIIEEELPVELTSFDAHLTQELFVSLQWVSQSETALSGYNVFRSTDVNLSNAIQVNSSLIQATNTAETHTYNFQDVDVITDNIYYYWLQNVDNDGTLGFNGPVSISVVGDGGSITPPPTIANTTGLKLVYPNPFTGYTNISYNLTKDVTTTITIYNLKGQLVRVLNNGFKRTGYHTLSWDCFDSNGQECGSGIYLIHMTAGNQQSFLKAVLMK